MTEYRCAHIAKVRTCAAHSGLKCAPLEKPMPTAKPRVTITLEQSTHDVIERLAALQGRTRGVVIAELLDEVVPALSRTVALLEAAAAAPQQVKAGLRAVVEGVHRDLVAVSGDGIGQLDMLLGAFSGGAAEGANPHVVTRGSGMDTHGGQHATEQTGKARPRAAAEPVSALEQQRALYQAEKRAKARLAERLEGLKKKRKGGRKDADARG